MLMSMICPAQRNNKESSWALIHYWEEWQDCKYIMDGSASSRECWKENPYTEDSMKTLLWTTLPWYGVKPNLLSVFWNCLFNVLSTGLCLEAVTWRVVSSSGKSGGAALCAVCSVLCAAPVLCTTRHWANSRCGTSQLKMAQFPKRSAKSELLWIKYYYRWCDGHSWGILCFFSFVWIWALS